MFKKLEGLRLFKISTGKSLQNGQLHKNHETKRCLEEKIPACETHRICSFAAKIRNRVYPWQGLQVSTNFGHKCLQNKYGQCLIKICILGYFTFLNFFLSD